MHICKPTEASQPPIGMAGFACMVCLAVVYLAARPLMNWLDIWWAGVLLCSVIPIAVAFLILYRSSWHRELPRVTRILSTILMSCLLFCCVLIVGLAILAAWFVVAHRFTAFKD